MLRPEEDVGTILEEIASSMGRKLEARRWKKVLADNLFNDCLSISLLRAEDWVAMDIPLCVLSTIKQRMGDTPFKVEPSPGCNHKKSIFLFKNLGIYFKFCKICE